MFSLSKSIAILLMVMTSCLVFAKPTIDYCQTCQNVNEFIRNMERNQTEFMMRNNLYKFCLRENEGSNSKVCAFLSATMHNTLMKIGNKDFCTKINACPSGKTILKLESPNSERCEFCTNLLESFKSLVTENSQNLIKESLSNYCELTDDFQDECKKSIDDNLANLIDFVQNKMDSETFCHAIDSCNLETSDKNKLPSIGDLVSLRDPIQMANHLDFIEKQDKLKSVSSNDLNNPLVCFACREVVTMIYARLHKNLTRKKIEHLLAESCKTIYLVNKEKERDCELKVEKNAEIIINGFINKVPPTIVCLLTGMCLPGQVNGQENETVESKKLENILSREQSNVNVEKNPVNFLTKINKSKGLECFFCEEILKFFLKELNQTQTREYVKYLLDKSCSTLFKNEDKKNKCQEYVDSYTEKLIDLIEKTENTGLICNTLHMCQINSSLVYAFDEKRLNYFARNQFKKSPIIDISIKSGPVLKFDTCEICKLSYPIFEEIIKIDSVKEEIRESAYYLCDKKIFPIEDCRKKIDKYIEVLATISDSNVGCQKLTLCPLNKLTIKLSNLNIIDLTSIDSSSFNQVTIIKNVEKLDLKDTECSVCKILVKDAYEDLTRIVHRDSTQKLVNKVCEFCPKVEVQKKCKDEALKALQALVEDLKKSLPPQQVCELMNYCKPKGKTVFSTNLNHLPQIQICGACKSLFPIAHKLLQNKDVSEVAKSTLITICNLTNFTDKCEESVNQLLENLSQEETPNKGCSTLCKDESISFSSFEDLLKVSKELIPKKDELLGESYSLLPNNSSAICEKCKKVMRFVHRKVMDQRRLKDDLIRILFKTCPLKDNKCREFYRKYVDYFYGILVRNTIAENACSAMKLCSNGFELIEPSNNEFMPTLEETEVCKECQKAIQYLLKNLNNKNFLDFLLKEVQENVCQPLSLMERKACDRLVKDFGPKILKHLISKIDQNKICNQELKLCKDYIFSNDDLSFDLINFIEDLNCVVCTRSVEKLNKLEKDTNKSFTVEEICGKDDTECSQFMFNFLDFFLENDRNRDHLIACTELDVCLIPGKVQLLGGDKCKYGPAYACLSAAHANACKATEFCQKNYWKANE